MHCCSPKRQAAAGLDQPRRGLAGAQDAKRPQAKTALANLVLAGDWTQTGLPATIEGALRSGETAARLV
jgi:uncharacterized protein with NAD-binding domain and iron-sulfur cluster